MAEIQKKPVKIVETVLRDAHQSLHSSQPYPFSLRLGASALWTFWLQAETGGAALPSMLPFVS